MKKNSILALVVLMAVLVVPLQHAWACLYEYEPKNPSGKSGAELTLTFTITATHDPCELDPQDVKLTLDNVSLKSQTRWKRVERMTFESRITVKLGAPGKGIVRVWRSCSRAGTHGKSVTITITP